MVDEALYGKCASRKHIPAEVSMSRNEPQQPTGNLATSVWRRARQTAVRLEPAVGKVMPLAKNAGTAVRHQTDKTRAWAAPQVEKAGQVVQDDIAPKVSSLLSAAARRLEPEKPRRRNWRKVAGVSAVTAAASVLAAAVRSRMKARAGAASGDAEDAGGVAGAETAPAAETAAATETPDGQRSPSRNAAEGTEHPLRS
jgi:hypothetical protein